jgi:hypothetical protein
MSNLFSSKPYIKPLKGASVSSNLGVFDTVTANTLKLENINIAGVFEDGQLINVVIIDSELRNTAIGIDGPNVGYFTQVQTRSDVSMLSNIYGANVTWNPDTAQFYISSSQGSFKVDGCSYLGNLEVCRNDVKAVNLNGDVNIIPNNLGTINLKGAITNIASRGNYYSEVQRGGVSFIVNNDIVLNSSRGKAVVTTGKEQVFTTINGDISLNVDTGIIARTLVSASTTAGNIILTTPFPHQLNAGDVVMVTNGSLNGGYTVASVITDTSIYLTTTTGSVFSSSGGSLIKVADNNINLNTNAFVKIPEKTRLTFGDTSNSISGFTGGINVTSIGDVVFDVDSNSAIRVPQTTALQFGTSGNNYVAFNGSQLNINSNVVDIGGTLASIDTTNTRFYDPILTLANYDLQANDGKDRGIEFKYFDTASDSMKLAWFGFKNQSKSFTFIPDATNTNETITGNIGNFELSFLSVNNIALAAGGQVDMSCGKLLNVSQITGCSNNLTIAGSTNVTVNATNRISLAAAADVLVPNNVPVKFGTSGSYIQETLSSNVLIKSANNTQFVTSSKGSIIIPTETYVSFDGSSTGNQRISSNTSGDLSIATNKSLYLTTTGGNVIVPSSTRLQFGASSQNVSGTTSGISVVSSSSQGTVDIISNSNVNISTSSGNVVLAASTGDIILHPSSGSVRIPSAHQLVFESSGSSNSISSSQGTFLMTGSGSNALRVANVNTIDLLANASVNIPTGTKLTISTEGDKYLLSDSTHAVYLSNLHTAGSLTLTAKTTTLTNTAGSLNIVNSRTDITSSSFIITGTTGSIARFDTDNIQMRDPIITISERALSAPDNLDRGVEYKYFADGTKLGWFGWKNTSKRFTFYADAVNTGEVISGTMGDMEAASVYINKSLSFASSGFLDMSCGTIANVNTVVGCNGTINLNGSNSVNLNAGSVMLNASSRVQMPFNVPLNFGSSANSLSCDTSGNLIVKSGKIVVDGDLQINGTTVTLYSTVTNIQDPILSIGGVTGPVVNDFKDRGIEFKWSDNVSSKVGFFGYQANTRRFVYIKDGTNNNEVFSGSYGDVEFGGGYFSNIGLYNGEISGVRELSGGQVTLKTTAGNVFITPTQGSNVLLPYNTTLALGTTENGIRSDTAGNMMYTSYHDTTILSKTGSVNISTSEAVRVPSQVPFYFGANNSTYMIKTSAGNLDVVNNSGDLDLIPTSMGSINIPTNSYLNFGSSTNSIFGDGKQLVINGWNGVAIATSTLTIAGNINVIGTLTASTTSLDLNQYILPLGTNTNLEVNSIANASGTNGNINVTTKDVNYLRVGDSVTLLNSYTEPNIDGTYAVTSVLGSKSFTVTKPGFSLTTSSSSGTVKSNLMFDKGKDVGIQVNYWSTVGNTSISSGSAGYKTGFFGFKRNTERWSFYTNVTNNNSVVTGELSDIEVNKVFTSRMSGFTLDGAVSAGSNQVSGTNFQVGGGSVNNTPIGTTSAASGRFTTLSNTTQALLTNVTLQSNLAYAFERYTLSSANPVRPPTEAYVVSMFSVVGVNFTSSSGTMPTTNIPDGAFKILVCSAMGEGCTHTVHFGVGKLITPNPLNTTVNASKLIFKRRSQSAQLIWDNIQGAWILLSSGCYVA